MEQGDGGREGEEEDQLRRAEWGKAGRVRKGGWLGGLISCEFAVRAETYFWEVEEGGGGGEGEED